MCPRRNIKCEQTRMFLFKESLVYASEARQCAAIRSNVPGSLHAAHAAKCTMYHNVPWRLPPKTNRPLPHLSTNKSFSQSKMKNSSKLSSIRLATRSHPGVPAISFTASLSWLTGFTGCPKPIQPAREKKIPH